MNMQDWSLIVLAAGRGTRLGGPVPKPLVLLDGKPLIEPIIRKGLDMGFRQTIIVISEFTAAVAGTFPDPGLTYVTTEPRGTGYCALAGVQAAMAPHVLIAQADDSYFYSVATLENICTQHDVSGADFTIGTTLVPAGSSYTGIIVDEQGRFMRYDKGVAAAERQAVCGLYAANRDWLLRQLPLVPADPNNGEFGLPWVAELPGDAALMTYSVPAAEWHGINTPQELAAAANKFT